LKPSHARLPTDRGLRDGVAIVVLLLLCTFGNLAQGQDTKHVSDSVALRIAESFAVPESPAFSFLQFAPATVTRPNTPRDIVAALANGIGEDGKVRQGISLEVTPAYLIPGLGVNLVDYQTHSVKRLLANTQLSFATVRAAGDSASTDMGVGIRFNVIDNGDPMRYADFTTVLARQMRACAPATPGASAIACLSGVSDSLRAEFAKAHWNATRFTVALATGLRFDQSRVSHSRALGWNAWAALTAPLGMTGQMIGYLAVTHRPAVPGVASFSAIDFGGRVLIGSPGFNTFLEVVGDTRFDTADSSNTSTAAWSGGLEFRAAENLWLSTGFGTRFGDTGKPNKVILIANLKWGVSSRARLGR
jgi:hypothetical protein